MSWIPAFEIGFWNAWILTLFVILHPLVMKLVDKTVGTGNVNKNMGDTAAEQGEKWCRLSIPGFTQSQFTRASRNVAYRDKILRPVQ